MLFDIYQLIRPLDVYQKRYIRKTGKLYAKEDGQQYLQLFEILDNQKKYDEAAIEEAFQANSPNANVKVVARVLFEVILKCMRTFPGTNNPVRQQFEQLQDLSFFKQKGLDKHFTKLAKKANREFKKTDRFAHMLEIKSLEQEDINDNTGTENMADIYTDIRTLHQYLDLYRQSRAITQNAGNHSEEVHSEMLEELIKHPLLSDESKATTFSIKRIYLLCWSDYYLAKKMAAKAIPFNKKLVDLWEANPTMLRFDPISYKRNVSNYLANCLRNDQYEEFERVIVQLRSNTPFKNARDRAWELENVDYLSFMFSFRRLEFVNAKQKLEAMAIKLKAVRQFIEPLIELNLYYNFGLFCFFNQNLDESRQWFSHLQTTKLPLAGRLRNIAPLFESIIYCEDPDFDYETRLRVLNRHQRYYKDKEPDFPQGLPLLQILLKYAGAILPAEKKKHLKQFASKIDELPGHPGLEEMQLWAQSKVAKRPVFEILVETREAEMKQISSRT